MRRSCKYCGRFHREGETCLRKPQRQYKDTEVRRIHSSYKWTMRARQIKKRDNYLCQACLNEWEGTLNKYNTEDLEVHHIVKLRDDQSLAFDSSNLVTLCHFHHKQADEGTITQDTLRSWISPCGAKY